MAIVKTYTVAEVLQILGVTRRTFYRYVKGNQIKVIKLGREYRVKEDDLNDFICRGTDKNYIAMFKREKRE